MNMYKNTLVALMILFGVFAVEAVDITGDFKNSTIAIDVENKTNATHILSYVIDGTLSMAKIKNAICTIRMETPNTDFNIPVFYMGEEDILFHGIIPCLVQIKQDVITYNPVPGKDITITVDKDQPFVRVHITISQT